MPFWYTLNEIGERVSVNDDQYKITCIKLFVVTFTCSMISIKLCYHEYFILRTGLWRE